MRRPPQQPTWKQGDVLTAAILIAVVIAVFLGVFGWTAAGNPYSDLTCDELTRQLLTMTGVDATQPYDVETVADISAAGKDKGCPILP